MKSSNKNITKSIFLNSLITPKELWFWPVKKVKKLIHERLGEKWSKFIVDDIATFEEEESEFDFDIELDLNYYQEIKAGPLKEFYEELRYDPAMVEMDEIVSRARDFLKNKYTNIKFVDLSNYQKFNSEDRERITLEKLQSTEDVLIIEPLFNFNNINAIPFAILKQENQLTIFNLKATTTPKKAHIVDFGYDINVINAWIEQKGLDLYWSEGLFIYIKYEKLPKRSISFTTMNKVRFAASGYRSNIQNPDYFSNERISQYQKDKALVFAKPGMTCSVKEFYSLNTSPFKNDDTTFNIIINHDNAFFKQISKLLEWKKNNNPSLLPFKEYFCGYKRVNYFPELRYFWTCQRYGHFFCFSGNLIKLKDAYILYDKYKDTINDFESLLIYLYKNINCEIKINNSLFEYLNYLENTNTKIKHNEILNYDISFINFFKSLKNKVVYFDFESINPAIRVVDDTLPFMQIVNQVSVITDNGDGNLIPFNLVIDPLHFDNEKSFKLIIDTIIRDIDIKDIDNYSFVVFNKSFECSRIKEMAYYIKSRDSNSDKYLQIANKIINDIYDFNEWFKISVSNPRFMVIKELFGFSSIKKVLPLIEKYNNNIFHLVKCKNYKTELEIHNGSEAMKVAKKRFFNNINDKEWNSHEINLKLYCENDVRAMIAIEYWIRAILNITK